MTAMRFGLSTHLFHGERLSRAHLEAIASSGFDLVELFATRTHVDYHDARHIDELAGWLDALGLEAGSMHAPICEGFTDGDWGRAYSNAASDAARRDGGAGGDAPAFEAARRLGCGRDGRPPRPAEVAGRSRPATTTPPRAAQRRGARGHRQTPPGSGSRSR